MKTFLHIFSLFMVVLLANNLQAQEQIIIEPGAAGVLNQAIDNVANQGKILVLRRGFPYLLTGEVGNSGFKLHIKAEDGDGPRPIIIFAPASGGAAVDQLFRPRADITLEGLHLTNRDLLGGITERIIRASADSIVIKMDNCLVDDSGQAAFRLDGKDNRVYITNSIFSRIGVPSNPDNGRIVDDRGNQIDTLWIENSLIYNITSRIIRDGGGAITYFRFNQNTVANIAQRGFEVGEVEEMIFTNNIIANGAFLGRQFSLDPEEDDSERVILSAALTRSGNEKWTISHNNFFRDSLVVNATPAQQADGDTIVQTLNFSTDVLAIIDSLGLGATNIEENLVFAAPVPFSFDFISKHHAGDTGNALPWDHSSLTPNPLYSAIGAMVPRYDMSHDYGYSATTVSYRAGTEGQPIGTDIFGFSDISSTKNLFVENNILFFPNPVSDELYIQNLDAEVITFVRVFDLQGKLMQATKVDHQNLILPVNQFNNGIYILTITDQKGNISARKFVKQ
ncbi:MAG: T9SS type A sorting domain-containing protein [Saprospiraceae bacterium]|nr:T9SS type A sorting domain-containing protein [Saprospiraceae bacterium]